MAKRDDIIVYLNDLLNINDFNDYGPQGLQVEGNPEVNRIATAVSASVELFEQAAKSSADMIIVHHGILWERDSHVIKGGLKKRIKILLENDMTLLAYHLPLDKHAEFGNNALAAKSLGLANLQEFADVGIKGQVAPLSMETLLQKIKDLYHSDPLVFGFGPKEIARIGICSGKADKHIAEAIDSGLHAFITGEVSESIMHQAKEGNIHFIAAGHYATERIGIRALGEHLAQKFAVDITFIDIPNPV